MRGENHDRGEEEKEKEEEEEGEDEEEEDVVDFKEKKVAAEGLERRREEAWHDRSRRWDEASLRERAEVWEREASFSAPP